MYIKHPTFSVLSIELMIIIITDTEGCWDCSSVTSFNSHNVEIFSVKRMHYENVNMTYFENLPVVEKLWKNLCFAGNQIRIKERFKIYMSAHCTNLQKYFKVEQYLCTCPQYVAAWWHCEDQNYLSLQTQTDLTRIQWAPTITITISPQHCEHCSLSYLID